MGKLKNEAMVAPTEDIQEHKLTNTEFNYIKLLNDTLTFHTYGQKIASGFLYYICTQRLGYRDGINLQFELDFDNPEAVLLVKLLSENPSEAVAAIESSEPSL